MARRKDHKHEELREIIRLKALEIIISKGLKNLSARRLAQDIGYTPGTIYNFYPDMDSLVASANALTLGMLEEYCRHKIEAAPKGFAKIRALAHAYVQFAHENTHAWEAIFMRIGSKASKTFQSPQDYDERVISLFDMIEKLLVSCVRFSPEDARKSARLLWACLHGIAVLTLDGRLKAVGIEQTEQIIEDLLARYFGRKCA